MDWELLMEGLTTLLMSLWTILASAVRACIPAQFLSKKDVTQDLVLITGAGSGIGRLMAIQFAKLGSKLVLWDINTEGNEETAAEIKKFGGVVQTYTVDLSKREQIYTVADKVKAEVGDVSILVNNAGIVTGKKFLQSPDGLIEKSMEVNTMSHFWTVKAFLPSMLDKDHGHIVSIASSAGLSGVNGLADYCASKFGAVGFNDALHLELSALHKNVQTTVVCPFFINTGMFDGVRSRFPRILPILEPEYAVNKIMEAILLNQEILYIPKILYPLLALKGVLPVKAGILLHRFFGTTASMDEFKGRAAKLD